MILFFDRSVGKSIPQALLLLNAPVGVVYHQQVFPPDEKDDQWLPTVGGREWIVIGQDYKYHRMPNELAALKQHKVGCFYLWGATARRWETMRVFAKAFDRIIEAAGTTERPFVYRVSKQGRITAVPLQ
ncbi:MAG: hypothetical protein QME71_06530 [Dehalococcoidia bacterium]|nr:hypothetical protein [Dehalococcoidia bacterium]